MTQEQKDKDKDLMSRLLISKELGHEREQITAVYLGRKHCTFSADLTNQIKPIVKIRAIKIPIN